MGEKTKSLQERVKLRLRAYLQQILYNNFDNLQREKRSTQLKTSKTKQQLVTEAHLIRTDSGEKKIITPGGWCAPRSGGRW